MNSFGEHLRKSTMILLVVLSIFYFLFTLIHIQDIQYADQAENFLTGKFSLSHSINTDVVVFQGNNYWHKEPFPSVLLMPLVAVIDYQYSQQIMHFLLVLLLIYLVYYLVRLKNKSKDTAWYLTFAFIWGSFIIGLAVSPKSWYFSQILALDLSILILIASIRKEHLLKIGFLFFLLMLTRPTAIGFLAILIYKLLKEKNTWLKKIWDLSYLLLPIGFSLLTLLLMNYLRFGDPLFITYTHMTPPEPFKTALTYGLFSLQHIPTNFFYYFLNSVQRVGTTPDHLVFPYITYNLFGTSIAVIAPFFIYLLLCIKKFSIHQKQYLLLSGCIILFWLAFYAGGWVTFGPRYFTDFFPFLLLVILEFLEQRKTLFTSFEKTCIVISASFNMYLLYSRFFL